MFELFCFQRYYIIAPADFDVLEKTYFKLINIFLLGNCKFRDEKFFSCNFDTLYIIVTRQYSKVSYLWPLFFVFWILQIYSCMSSLNA